MLRKPLLVNFCAMVQVLLSVFSISFIKSLGDCTYLQHQETTSFPFTLKAPISTCIQILLTDLYTIPFRISNW